MSLEILVVDDDEDFLALVKYVFQVYKDAKVRDVANSREAAALIEGYKYDGIFLDLNMPGLDGFELATRARASEINKQTPIMVITAETDLESMRKIRAAGATFIINKPVSRTALKKIFDTTQGAMWAERLKRGSQTGPDSEVLLRTRSAPQTLLLVVDDDPSIHDLVGHALRNLGHIEYCATATEGLQALQTRPFDLLFLDLGLPDMHGLELLARLRQIGRDTRVVVITADDTPESLLRAIREDAYEYLRKPFTVEQIAELAGRALSTPREPEIKVLSAKREWLELSTPCTRDAVERIEHFVRQLGSDLSLELLEPIAQAFRELLMNAVEWGGGLDPQRRVQISCLRTPRMLFYRIADPGPGFSFEGLTHSAAGNPDGVLASSAVRVEKGIRPGGLGILMVRAIADDLLYNERHNEVVLVKYL